MVMEVPLVFKSKKANVDDECRVNSFMGSVLMLIWFIYIMVDNNRGSRTLDQVGGESVLDLPRT